MKLSRTLLPIAALAMIAAPTIASAATVSIGKHHKADKAAKPATTVKTKTVKAKKAK